MDYNAIWNEICFHVNKNLNASERDFQTTIEFMFEKLGWSLYKGEIVTQKVIPIGSANSLKPDIVIMNDEQIIFVIELKKPNVMISERNKDQLKSYMRQLKLSFGILLGETLQVYYEVPSDNELPIMVKDIPFMNDSDDGAECIKLLSKVEYAFDRLQKYCVDSLAEAEKYKKSQKYVDLLCSEKGQGIVADLLKEKLLAEFSEEIVSLILDKIRIHISRKEERKSVSPLQKPYSQTHFNNHSNSPKADRIVQTLSGTSDRDTTTYDFDGRIYNKTNLPRAVVSKYVEMNPDVSIFELQSHFNFVKNVIVSRDEADTIAKSSNQPRHNKKLIRVSDGEIAVSNQWTPGKIGKFINIAQQLGFEIESL